MSHVRIKTPLGNISIEFTHDRPELVTEVLVAINTMHLKKYVQGFVLCGDSVKVESNHGPIRVNSLAWASYQIRQISGCAFAGNAENAPTISKQRKPLINDTGMHNGTWVTHVPCCMLGSLTRMAGKHSRHSRRMCNPQMNVSPTGEPPGHPSICNTTTKGAHWGNLIIDCLLKLKIKQQKREA